MQKYILGNFLIIILLVLASCGERSETIYFDNTEIEPDTFEIEVLAENTERSEPVDPKEEDEFSIIESGDNFRVLQLSESEIDLRFEILNNSGEVIWDCETWRGGFEFIGDNLLRYSAGGGTYTWGQIYFCPREDILSEEFMNPFFLKDRLVALFDFDENKGRTIVVRDIFDPEKFYREFILSDYVEDLRFTVSGTITYLGNDEIEISELFFGEDYDEAIFVLSIA